MKLISLVAIIFVVQTKLSFLDSRFMGNEIQVQGCRNIVIPPNKGWTWSNPFAEFLHLCKTGHTYNHIGRFTSQRQGLSKCLSQLNCVAQKLLSYESRVKAMQTDFHNHQNRWKCLQTSVLKCQTQLRQTKQALHRCMQTKRRRRTPRYDDIVEYPEDEYEDDGNENYDFY